MKLYPEIRSIQLVNISVIESGNWKSEKKLIYAFDSYQFPLQSATGDKVVVGQLTAVGEKQLFELGQLLQKELIDRQNGNGVISEKYDPGSV